MRQVQNVISVNSTGLDQCQHKLYGYSSLQSENTHKGEVGHSAKDSTDSEEVRLLKCF